MSFTNNKVPTFIYTRQTQKKLHATIRFHTSRPERQTETSNIHVISVHTVSYIRRGGAHGSPCLLSSRCNPSHILTFCDSNDAESHGAATLTYRFRIADTFPPNMHLSCNMQNNLIIRECQQISELRLDIKS